MTLNFANLTNNIFCPPYLNWTVILRFSPLPSILTTFPMPKRWCSMTHPSRSPFGGGDEVPEDDESGVAEDDGFGETGDVVPQPVFCFSSLKGRGSTVTRGFQVSFSPLPHWLPPLDIVGPEEPTTSTNLKSMSLMKRLLELNSGLPYLNRCWALVMMQCFSALVMAT